MNFFLHIFLTNIVPLSIMILVGVLLYRVFKLDIRTLSKLNFYLFSPVVIFKLIYESSISVKILGQVLLFFVVFMFFLTLLAEIVLRIRDYRAGMRSAMRNSVIFYNSANYAIPLNQLVFVGDPFTLSIQMIIMMMQSLLPNTYGVYSVNRGKQELRESVRTILRMPVIYTIPLAFLLKGFHVEIPGPIYVPVKYVADAFMATALLTLGVQLGSMKWKIRLSDVMISNTLRLCAAPLLGYLVVLMLGITGPMAQALVLSCAVPTSLSSVILAVEFDNEPEFSSQAVFSSTMFSTFTVTLVIYLIGFIH